MRVANRHSLAVLIAVAGLTLAACQSSPPPESQGTPVQPTAEGTQPDAGQGKPPADSGAPAPGSIIRWDDRVSADPGAATTAPPPPSGTTVSPPPARADSGTIRWNTPQQGTPTTVPGAPVGPPVNWRSGVEGDTVWVEVVDPQSFYRVDRVDLVAPDGRAFAARDVSRTQARYDYSAGNGGGLGVGVGSWGGSRHSGTSVGLGIGFPLGGSRGTEREDNATRSVARFQLADPASYARTAPQWSVHVRLVDRYGQPSVARFPAPVPIR